MARRYMDWRSWLKPEPVRQPERLPAPEARIISAWGMTQQAWESLTEIERADKRFNVAKAPRFTA